MRSSPVLLSELGLIRIVAASPMRRYELSAFEFAEVPLHLLRVAISHDVVAQALAPLPL